MKGKVLDLCLVYARHSKENDCYPNKSIDMEYVQHTLFELAPLPFF